MSQSVGVEIAHQAEGRDPRGAAGIRADPDVAVRVLADAVDRVLHQALLLSHTRYLRAVDDAQSRHRTHADAAVTSDCQCTYSQVDEPIIEGHRARILAYRWQAKVAF